MKNEGGSTNTEPTCALGPTPRRYKNIVQKCPVTPNEKQPISYVKQVPYTYTIYVIPYVYIIGESTMPITMSETAPLLW